MSVPPPCVGKRSFPTKHYQPFSVTFATKICGLDRSRQTAPICAAISERLSQENISKLFTWDLNELQREGEPLVAAEQGASNTIAKRGMACYDAYGRLGIKALAINSGERISEVGELVYRPKNQQGLGYDLSIHFWMRSDGQWVHSLRSELGGLPCYRRGTRRWRPSQCRCLRQRYALFRKR